MNLHNILQSIRSFIKSFAPVIAPLILIIFGVDISGGVENLDSLFGVLGELLTQIEVWVAILITAVTEFWDWFQDNLLSKSKKDVLNQALGK
jgi:hypothetical protein